ncbi:MAG: transcription elongation factor GreA [Candidatus Omnitrophica bacterium]|nr:transcription elongation factor GreA [Candidatus Omnitrophota bacterium]
MDEVYLTRKGHQKLVEEVEYLKNTKRRELAQAIAHARSFGDLSENAEYEAAKEAQAQNEQRIAELEQKLAGARIIPDEEMSSDEVLIGATVELEDMDTGERLQYMLVSEVEADYEQGRISVSSPVGKGLLNHKVNEVIEIPIPAGTLTYKIIAISRE